MAARQSKARVERLDPLQKARYRSEGGPAAAGFDITLLMLSVAAGLWYLASYLRAELPPRAKTAHNDAGTDAADGPANTHSPAHRCSLPVRALRSCTQEIVHRMWLPASASRQALAITKIVISYCQTVDVFARFSA